MLHSHLSADQSVMRGTKAVYALCPGSPGEGQEILSVGLGGVYGGDPV